jgi:hypothetical protein
MVLPQKQRTLIFAPLDKTREFPTATLCPLHERISGTSNIPTVGLHADLTTL